MHTVVELGAGVPAFLAKLWKLVQDPETDDLICWSPSGRSFFIRNQAQFARELLPHYYKHNNMASFVRQLNMYGFHKKVSVELGGLKCDKDEMEFAHQYFCKEHPYLVEHIKRKIASSKGQDPAHPSIKPELMNKMLTDVRNMRGRQEHLDSRLGAMKHENEALWRELALLRQKHMKQQQIVNKLIHFLVTLVQPSRGGGLSVKRRYPLMIDDASRARKQSKLSKPQTSHIGPVIHELDASEPNLDSEYIVTKMLRNEAPTVHSPESTEAPTDDDNLETIHLVEDPLLLEDDVEMVNARDTKKKRALKGKKKRKNKRPMKILISSLENGEKPREKLNLLEMPAVEEVPFSIALMTKESISSKPVPMSTVPSSKLMAMARINKSEQNIDQDDAETSGEIEDDTSDNDTSNLVKLEDILIVPDITNDDSIQRAVSKKNYDTSPQNNKEFYRVDSGKSILKGINDKRLDENETSKLFLEEKDNCNKASTSTSKDLSLSCVNSSGVSEASYRLGSTEEMDNHLETMQAELENLREILRGEGYSIDATLFGLFGADDPMSFGLPVNPELNPNCEKEHDDHTAVAEPLPGSACGELMAYNPASNLFDFNDDVILENTSPALSTPATMDSPANNLYSSDLLDLEDSKTSFLDSLVTNDADSKS